MKKLFLLPFLIIVAWGFTASAFTFTYQGQTLAYNVIDTKEKLVAVSGYEGSSVTGDLILPSTVRDGKNDYTLAKINDRAFAGMPGITSVNIPNTVTEIGKEAFMECKALTNVSMYDSVKKIGYRAFKNCTALSEVTLSDNIDVLAQETFSCCSSLKSVTLPEKLTILGPEVFASCSSLGAVTFSSNLVKIGDRAFSWCTQLSDVDLPNSLITIGEYAFNRCMSLRRIKIPDNVEQIGANAFNSSNNLELLEVGESVKEIGASSFQYCTKLSEVHTYAVAPPSLGTSSFSQITRNRILYVPKGSKEDYDNSIWSQYFSEIKEEVEGGVEIVEADENTVQSAEYYTVNGLRLSVSPTVKGIYIERRGSKCTKLIIK